MPKRPTEEKNDPKSNFDGDNSDVILKKKIKLEHEKKFQKLKKQIKKQILVNMKFTNFY